VTQPAREELPVIFGLKLIGYFFGLVALMKFSFILAPLPIVTYGLRGQRTEARIFIVVAVLAGIMSAVIGIQNLILPNLIYANLGWLIAWSIQQQVPYTVLVKRLFAIVIAIQLAITALDWNEGVQSRQYLLETFRAELESPESKEFSEQQEQQLNIQIWLLENWTQVTLGFSAGGVLVGLCISLSWMFRILRRTTSIPIHGSFTDLRPYDWVVWFVILLAAMWFIDSRNPQPMLQFVGYNLAIGLFVLYGLNGLGVLMYGLDVLKPNPLMALAFIMLLFMFGGAAMLSFLGLFDTWGEFRKRIDARAAAIANPPDSDEFD
jgi:hypothetical protein